MSKNQPVDEQIKHILGHCPAKSHICWFSEMEDKLKKEFGGDSDTAERALAHYQEKAIIDLCQAECNRARLSERKMIALDIYRGHTFSESTDWKAKYQKFIDNNEKRIAELQQTRQEEDE